MLACSCVREALSSPLSSKLESKHLMRIGLVGMTYVNIVSQLTRRDSCLCGVLFSPSSSPSLHFGYWKSCRRKCFTAISLVSYGHVQSDFKCCWSRVAVIIDGENTYTGFFIFSSGNWWGEKPGHSAKLLCFRDFGMDSLYSCYIPAAVVLSRKHAGIIYCTEKLVNSCRSKLG